MLAVYSTHLTAQIPIPPPTPIFYFHRRNITRNCIPSCPTVLVMFYNRNIGTNRLRFPPWGCGPQAVAVTEAHRPCGHLVFRYFSTNLLLAPGFNARTPAVHGANIKRHTYYEYGILGFRKHRPWGLPQHPHLTAECSLTVTPSPPHYDTSSYMHKVTLHSTITNAQKKWTGNIQQNRYTR